MTGVRLDLVGVATAPVGVDAHFFGMLLEYLRLRLPLPKQARLLVHTHIQAVG